MLCESERMLMQESLISFMFPYAFGGFAATSTRIAPDERALSAEGGSTLIAPDDASGTRRPIFDAPILMSESSCSIT